MSNWDKFFKVHVISKKKPETRSGDSYDNTYDSYLKDSNLKIHGQEYESIKKFNKIIKKNRKDEFEKMLKDTVGLEWFYNKHKK